MENNNMTAVEWLIERIESISHDLHHLMKVRGEFEQAKQMEKEQLLAAWKKTLKDIMIVVDGTTMNHTENTNMTAVEWFYQQTVIEGETNYYELLEQAKIMEETHIRMAWTDGHALGKNGLVVVDYSNSKEYYDKYYKR